MYVFASGWSSDGAMVTYSSSGLPPGLSYTNGVISGTIADDAAGSYPVTLTASDPTANGTAANATATFTWIVSPPMVTLSNPGNQTNLAGSSVYVYATAWSSDGAMVTYSASGLPTGLSYANGIISGTITDDAAGSYTVTLTASDPTANGTAADATATFTWTVNPPMVTLSNPGNQTNLAGLSVYVFATGWSSDGAMVTYSSSGLPPGLSYTNGVISGTIADDAAGSYPVTLTASDPTANGTAANATATFTWTVSPPMVTLSNPGNQTNLAGSSVYVYATAWSSDGAMVTYNASGLPPGLSYTNGIISGTIADDAAGSYTVTLTASDPTANGTATDATATFTWTVNPPVVMFSNPGNQTNQAGFSVYVYAYAWSSDGAMLTYSATDLPPGLSYANGVISGTIADDAAGSYTVTLTATDPTASVSATVSFIWTVN